MKLGMKLGGTGSGHRGWPALLLVLVAVLVPTAGVLWFMSQAVNQQREVARQHLAEAYRSQLSLLRDRLDSYWEARAEKLAKSTAQDLPPVAFQRSVTAGLADSLIYLNRDGSIAYPSIPALPRVDPTEQRSDWSEARTLESKHETLRAAAAAYGRIARAERNDAIAARALQAQIRCLVQSGQKEAAALVIERQFTQSSFAEAADLQGRIVAADEQLLLLNLQSRDDHRYLPAARRLYAMLSDYEHWRLPSSQRLFLMEEMRALNLDRELSTFATYDAESLVATFLERDRGRAGDSALRLSAVPDVWKITSNNGLVIALYRTQTVFVAMRRFLDDQNLPQGVVFAVAPPGARTARHDEATPAGARLPGWQLTLTFNNSEQFDSVARRQMASYVWIGFLLIATMAVLALVTGEALRRQMRLASLKTDLVAAVSHELKTPLSSMRLLVDSLLDDSQVDPKKTREYLELIAQENSRLSRLIDNFLTFSRLERGRQKFSFSLTRPDEIVRAVVDAAGERFRVSDCRLGVEISPGLPPLHADGDALTTVLLNLLDNAYKFTPHDKRIDLRAYSANGCVYFEVADNGIGLATREQKKVFRRFYQVDRQLARESGGVGLGLSIVEFIVKAHKGMVQVKSKPGTGSTFTVTLPCAAASVQGAAK